MSFITQPLSRLTDWALHARSKHVYYFNEGSIEDMEFLGKKGATLCEMSRLGLPVPPGFVISSEACVEHFEKHKEAVLLCESLKEEYSHGIRDIERRTGMFFGGINTNHPHDISNKVLDTFPLLLSVRAGPSCAIPGMLDTVLNVGMSDTAAAIITSVTNPSFANDIYRRYLQMFGVFILGIDPNIYLRVLTQARERSNVEDDTCLNQNDLLWVVAKFKEIAEVPQDPWKQLEMIVHSVFHSWYSPRACKYREVHSVSSKGVAVTVQAMVFGNYNERSGTGIAHTRNPCTGENILTGQFLLNAEGEEIVTGTRKGINLDEMRKILPGCYDSLFHFEKQLERHFRDMQTIEFTIQNGALYILETWNSVRTPTAGVHVAVSMVQENIITEREALLRINPDLLSYFLQPTIDPTVNSGVLGLAERILGKGTPYGSGGSVTGAIVVTKELALDYHKKGVPSVFCCDSASLIDPICFKICEGIISNRETFGNDLDLLQNSNKTGIAACNIAVDNLENKVKYGKCQKLALNQGEIITIDGSSGIIYKGAIPTIPEGQDYDFHTIMRWADKYKRLPVLAMVENFEEAKRASQLRANGLGICKTDYMFKSSIERVSLTCNALLSLSQEDRSQCFDKLLPQLQQDFEKVLRLFPNKHVGFMLASNVIDQVLPIRGQQKFNDDIATLAKLIGISEKQCEERCEILTECSCGSNCGSRLCLTHPDIVDLQVRALLGAASELNKEGVRFNLNLMIPGVAAPQELACIVPTINIAEESIQSQPEICVTDYQIGTIVDIPYTLLKTDSIAQEEGINCVSVDINEITSLMHGFSGTPKRKFMSKYLEMHILPDDPLKTIDKQGVGSLLEAAVEKARSSNVVNFKIGFHGSLCGDCATVKFLDKIRADFISCPIDRVPVAKLAAAQSHIKQLQSEKPFHTRNYSA